MAVTEETGTDTKLGHAMDAAEKPWSCQKRCALAYCLAIFALALGGRPLAGRSIPGGPFISISGDILPGIAAWMALRLLFLCLREPTLLPKLVAFPVCVIVGFAIARVAIDIVEFQMNPFARGAGIGP
jgi:hypothetical protein